MRASVVIAALAASAQAALTITQPSASNWWIADSVNNIAWTCGNGNPAAYTVVVTNPDVKLLTGPLAVVGVLNDYICSYSYTPGSELRVGTGYTLSLTDILNSTHIYATSDPFEIKPKGSTYPPQVTPGAGASGSNAASGSGTATGSAPTSSPTNGAVRKGVGALLALSGLALGLTVA